MHGARLNDGLRPGRSDRVAEAGQPVYAGNQDVFDAAISELSAHTGPKFRPLRGLDPDSQDVAEAVYIDADGDVSGLVADLMTVANLDHQRVQIDDRIHRIQGPALPFQNLVQDGVGDFADRLPRDFGPDRGGQMMLDIADRHSAGIKADDH